MSLTQYCNFLFTDMSDSLEWEQLEDRIQACSWLKTFVLTLPLPEHISAHCTSLVHSLHQSLW